MKTIEIKTGSQTARFTTKSVTFDGREFFYANMSHVTNDVENHTYTFTCGDETKTLPYEEKDAKILNAIFSQVQKLEEKRHAAGENSETHDESSEAQNDEKADDSTATAEDTQTAGNAGDNADSSDAAADTQTADSTDDNVDNDDNTADNDGSAGDSTEAEASKDEQKPEAEPEKEKKPKKSFKERFASSKKEKTDDGSVSETADNEEPVDPEKLARKKKSFKIFAIILAVIIAASVIYYFAFGTSSAPSENSSNNTESQQYEDIDQLIDYLQ